MMNFFTIGQYFYKLYNTIFLILLVPLVAFMLLYLNSSSTRVLDDNPTYFYAIGSVVVIDWIVFFFLFDRKVKSISSDQGLRLKLERYYRLTIVRFAVVSSGCLLFALGFFLTNDKFFPIAFALNLLLLPFIWPTASKVCKDLKLRGDEYEMVFYKKDKF